MSYGFVYLLANECMPGLVKLGYTDRSPSQRADELSKSTGVPRDFDLLGYFELIDPRDHEQFFHQELREMRVNQSREFFELSVPVLVEFIERVIPMSVSHFVSRIVMEAYVEGCRRVGMSTIPNGGLNA